MECDPRVPSKSTFDENPRVKSGNCIAGRKERRFSFRVLKVAPKTPKRLTGMASRASNRRFGPKPGFWGGQAVILEVCVVAAPSPIPASISAPTPAPIAVPSLSFNVDVIRNLSRNLNRQPQPQILNISTSSLDMTT